MYLNDFNAFLTVIIGTCYLGSTETDIPIDTSFSLPTLNVSDTIDIPSGSSLVIKCTGIYELEWILPALNIADLQYRYNTTETVKETNGGLKVYENILTATRMVSNDTGLYKCHYKESENGSASSYVFVNDPNQLILPHMGNDHYTVFHGSRATVYCASTYSHINVTLRKVPEDSGLEQHGIKVEYDATKGFIIPSVSNYFNGMFVCIAHNGNVTEERYLKLHYFVIKGVPEPYIKLPDVYYHVVNGTFSLNCTIKIKRTMSLHLKWDYPNMMQNSGRIIEKKATAVSTLRSFKNLTMELRVTETQLSDAGKYKCTATDFRNNSASAEVVIKVYAIREPQFNFTNMDGTTARTPLEAKFEFNCYVEGFPFPEITWYKDGEMLDVSNKSGIELLHKSQKLIIHRVIDNDEGLYRCDAKNRGGTISANLTLSLYVKESSSKAKEITAETSLIIIITVIAILLVSLLIILAKRVHKERKEKQEVEFFNQALFKYGQIEMFNPDLALEDQVELLPYNDKWEFPKEHLKLGRTLGQGAFGRVVKAEAFGIEDGKVSTIVAVKMLKERVNPHQRKALMAELKIMIHLGCHLNIVNLLGAVTKNLAKGELMVIVEYCPYGNMRHYLLQKRSTFINQLDPTTGIVDPYICTLSGSPGIENIEKVTAAYENSFSSPPMSPNYRKQSIHYAELLEKRSTSNSDCSLFKVTENTTTVQLSGDRENPSSDLAQNGSYCKGSSPTTKTQPVTTCDLLCFAFQCARGMEYLALRKLIHRDLAARNVLMAEDNVVKICDFGLAKDCYEYSKYVKKGDGPLPLKWMAIESIRDKVFTSKSDVWSFGVLLWEFFTLGGSPYPGIDIDDNFYKKLKDGLRMEKPDYAPVNVYEIMEDCWKSDPNDRPDFTNLAESLGKLLQESVCKYYVALNEPYLTMNAESTNNNDYLQMGSEGKPEYANINVESLPGKSKTSNPYCNTCTAQPVDDDLTHEVPMDATPLIQLEPARNEENKDTATAPITDLAVSPFDNPVL